MLFRQVIRRAPGADVLQCGHEARQRRPLSYVCPVCPGRVARRVSEQLERHDVLVCGHRVEVPSDVLEKTRRRCEPCERATANGRQVGLFGARP